MPGTLPPTRLAARAFVMSMPVGLAALVLAGVGWVPPLAALLLWLAGLAGGALLLWRPLRGLAALQARLVLLGSGGVPPSTPAPESGNAELDAALRALARHIGGLQDAAARGTAFLDRLIDALPDPVLTVNSRRKVVQANRAAQTLFGKAVAGRDVEAVIRNPAVLEALDRVLAGHAGGRTEFPVAAPVEREFVCHTTPLEDRDGMRMAVLAFTDISDLRRTDRMRADFVANASHEIRTPLSTLSGCIETLRGPARDDPAAQEQFLEIMAQQSARMTRLVEDLLSLSRIEMNEHSPPRGSANVPLVLSRVIDVLASGRADTRQRVRLMAGKDLPLAAGDENELEQVFQNLIVNGLKYGGGNVEVTVDAADRLLPGSRGRGTALRVAVRDDGPGIPREHLPRLTERFYRVDTARSRQLGGTGLGLAIVKHIVNRHRGALTIDSTEGKGSTFTVYLPTA